MVKKISHQFDIKYFHLSFYVFDYVDNDGWPHYKLIEKLPNYIVPFGLGNFEYPNNWLKENSGENNQEDLTKLRQYIYSCSGDLALNSQLEVESRIISSGNITLMHNRSVAEDIKVFNSANNLIISSTNFDESAFLFFWLLINISNHPS